MSQNILHDNDNIFIIFLQSIDNCLHWKVLINIETINVINFVAKIIFDFINNNFKKKL